jgi:hypothetical protein
MIALVREKGIERVTIDPTKSRTAKGYLGDTIALEKVLDLHRERERGLRIRNSANEAN